MSKPITKFTPNNMTGLVLTAGGARGAYHAGVLKRLSEIPAFIGKPSPFKIVTGASAGAINGAAIAANTSDFTAGTRMIVKLWSNLSAKQVFRYDAESLARTGIEAAMDFAFGGLVGAGRLKSFVDASPLRRFLESNVDLSGIDGAMKSGDLYAFGVTATG